MESLEVESSKSLEVESSKTKSNPSVKDESTESWLPPVPILDYNHMVVQKEHILNKNGNIDDISNPLGPPPKGMMWRRLEDGNWELITDPNAIISTAETTTSNTSTYSILNVPIHKIAPNSCESDQDGKKLTIEQEQSHLLSSFILRTKCKDKVEAKFYLSENEWNLEVAIVAYLSDNNWESENMSAATEVNTSK